MLRMGLRPDRDKENSGIVLGALVMSAAVVLAVQGAFLQNVSAQSRNDVDFGSETIEYENASAIPVDVAEERAGVVPASAKSQPSAAAPAPAELPPASEQLPPNSGEMTTALNVKDADITALISTMARLTNRNYVVDNAVKGKVTIHQQTPVTIAEALRIFESVLLLKGFTSVPVDNNVWKIVPAKDARQTTIPVVMGVPKVSSDALVTQLVRLKNVQASDLQQVLSQFVSREGMINSFAGTNSLILIDSSANIERLTKLIDQLDVPATDQDMTIIPVLHADAKDIAEKINQILGQKEGEATRASNVPQTRTVINPARPPGQPGDGAPQIAGAGGGQAGGMRAQPMKVIADERTNSLIVVADPGVTARVQALVEQLDSPVDRSGGRFHVYRLKHADAESLAEILGSLIGGGGTTGGSTRTRTTGSSISRSQRENNSRPGFGQFGQSGMSRSDFGRSLRQSDAQGRAGTATGSTGGAVSVTGGGEKVNFEGEVSIAADTSTNSLIINSTKGDFLRLKEVIDELDVQRPQVMVEATILEVSLTKDEGMGVELQGTAGTDDGGVVARTDFSGLTNLLTNPAALSDLTIAAASTGTLTLPGGLTIPSQALLITAVSRNSNVNVLSAPTILATDNEEAEIIVGENVPFVSSTSTNQTNLNNTFNQIERQDVGITLRITPQISTGNFVILKIFVEISNVVTGTRNDPNGPTTTIRTTETTVEVKNGQMIVTGGLISDSTTESERGVPFFQDIPVLGQWFKRSDTNIERTNLLIFITPKIVKDNYDAREETVVARNKLQKEISDRSVEPDRAEVLTSENIDRVTEVMPPPSQLPTTITPPAVSMNRGQAAQTEQDAAAALDRTKRRLEALSAQGSDTPRSDGESPRAAPEKGETVEFVVKPKLPGSSKALKNTRVDSAQKSFVVLREIGAEDGASDTLGLVLLGSLDSAGGRFFEVGSRYTFKSGAQSRRYICIGKYSTLEEASAAHSALAAESNWRDLSVQELANLGRGPWTKG